MSADRSAIYDLGYRHYQGQRLGPWYGTRALFVHSMLGAFGLRRATRSKVVPMLLFAFALLPAVVIAVTINVQHVDKLPLAYTSYAPVIWLLLTIFVASQAPQAVSHDLRFRTIALYLSRPLARSQYVLAKYAALATAVFVFLAVPLTVMFAAALLTDLPVWDQVKGWLAGLAGAALFALVLSGIALVIAALTPRRGIGVGVIVAALVLLTGVVGTVQEIATQQGHGTLAEYLGMVGPFSLVDGVQVWLFHAEPVSGVALHGNLVGTAHTVAVLGLIAGCFGVLLLRYRKVLS
jgi:ABC-2 type transport system permease protein